MSTFTEKRALKAQIAAAKKAGKSAQTIGRLQYKLNNLAASPKGNAVRTKSTTNKAGQTVKGSVVKTGTGGTVRSKPNPNKTTGKRIISKGIARPTKTGGHPSALTKKKAIVPQTKPQGQPKVKLNKKFVPTVSAAPHARIVKSELPASTGTSQYAFKKTDDFSNVPRIAGTLPPVSKRTRREQIEAFRRRFKL